MADRDGQIDRPDQSNTHRDRLWPPCRGSSSNLGPRTGVLNESVLAFVAIADLTVLREPPASVRRSGPATRHARMPGRVGMAASRDNPVDILRCRIVWRLVAELFAMACEADLPEGAARRRPRCHVRQIAIYLSHVVLSVPYRTVATAFGRDRTTIVHACAVVEDRRDDTGYDRFVERCERCIEAVFAPLGCDHAEP